MNQKIYSIGKSKKKINALKFYISLKLNLIILKQGE